MDANMVHRIYVTVLSAQILVLAGMQSPPNNIVGFFLAAAAISVLAVPCFKR